MLRERIRDLAGVVVAPVEAVGALVRGEPRVEEPSSTWRAVVVPDAAPGPRRDVASRLAGPALVRLSGTPPRARHVPGALALDLRFGATVDDPDPPEALDLRLSTVRHLLSLPLGYVAADPLDYLRNAYLAPAALLVDGLGRVQIRVRGIPSDAAASADEREVRLVRAVDAEDAVLLLEVRTRADEAWAPLARIRLIAPAPVDASLLCFDPVRAARGVRPAGLVPRARRAVRAATRAGRELADRLPLPVGT